MTLKFDQDKEKVIGKLRMIRDELDRNINMIDETETKEELIMILLKSSKTLNKFEL